MRTLRVSLVSLSLLLSLLGVYRFPASAQSSNVISVDESTATTDFPNDIAFSLSATVEGEVASIDLVYKQANLVALELIKAEYDQAGDEITAAAFADLTVYFLPAGIDVTYHWVLTLDDGSIIETESETVTWLDERFEWDRLDGPGIEVYSYDRSDDFNDYVLEVSADAVVDMIALYQPESTFPIKLWVYESGEDYAGTLAENSQEWSAGSAYPDLQVIQAVIPDGSESEVLRIVPHEISHQILSMATENPFNAPATWIDEGLAVRAQTGGKDFYFDVAIQAWEDGELLSLRSLISVFPYDPNDAGLAYAESYSAIEFIIGEYGEASITGIVEAYRAGNSHNDVIILALGMSIEELDDAWRESLAEQATVLNAVGA